MSDDGDIKPDSPDGRTKPITRDTYERIWSHYKEGKSYSEISQLSGVAKRTVEKYINVGDPSRNMDALKNRLENLTKRMQSKLFDQHSRSKAKHYEIATEAFQLALESASNRIRIINRFPFSIKEVVGENGAKKEVLEPRELSDDDERRYALMVRTGKELADLMVTWHGVLRALYVGDESEQMLKDLERFTELGEVTPSLREKVKEIVAKEEGSAGKP